VKTILVYGSLKKGYWNHERFALGEPLNERIVVEGYKLVDLGAYPAAVPSKHTDTIVCECYVVDDRTFQRMNWMEQGAGYKPASINNAIMWIYDHPEETYHLVPLNEAGQFEWLG
jgi:gamma-glutamylcyclotransferase (GGCT)/AIG2-like uncharacterized protein YtfP